MRETFLFRRLSFPATITTAVTTASKSIVVFNHLYRLATTSATDAVKVETHQSNQNNNGNGQRNWVTLPPFTSTVNATSLGKRITRGNSNEEHKSVTETITALKWVLRCCPELPRSLVQKLFRLRQVRRKCLEGYLDHGVEAQGCQPKRVGAKDFMNIGDRILLPVTVKGSPVKKCNYECSEDELNFVRGLVLYKDSAIIAINKPPKLPVQVHRLDRDSSGILVLGRSQTSTAVLHSIFREKTVGILGDKDSDRGKRALQKRYLALVFGAPKELKGLISAPLAKVVVDDGKSERITVVDSASLSQHAVTEYRVIETSTYGYTWLELSPLTGRKHQLRVHCAEVLGTPIVGDYKYGWQAHRKWEPLPFMTHHEEFQEVESHHFGINLECGCITQKQPHLHLHCKQMILPNISLALKHASLDSNHDFSKLESLNLVAPLPWHMQRSWNLLKFLVKQDHCS